MHGRCPLDKKKYLHVCLQYTATVSPEKLCTRKELVMMKISSSDFHTSSYILAIKRLEFYFPQVWIIGTNQCGNTCREALKRCRANKYVLCCHDHAEILVAIVSH